MSGYDDIPSQEDYDDAVIEDTTHCDLCKRTVLVGDSDCLISSRGWAICSSCAEEAAKLYQEALEDAGVCEHGVNDGDWCEDCNREYKRAANDQQEPNDAE